MVDDGIGEENISILDWCQTDHMKGWGRVVGVGLVGGEVKRSQTIQTSQ